MTLWTLLGWIGRTFWRDLVIGGLAALAVIGGVFAFGFGLGLTIEGRRTDAMTDAYRTTLAQYITTCEVAAEETESTNEALRERALLLPLQSEDDR